MIMKQLGAFTSLCSYDLVIDYLCIITNMLLVSIEVESLILASYVPTIVMIMVTTNLLTTHSYS